MLFGDHVGISLGTAGIILGLLGTIGGHWGKKFVGWGAHLSNLMNLRLVSGPCGSPFFAIGVHYFDSWGFGTVRILYFVDHLIPA